MTPALPTVASPVAWDHDEMLPAWPGLPALDGPTRADACVVGLGGSGLAAVEELADRGLDVVGIDAGRVAAGAAGRNGGILSGGGALIRTDVAADGPDLRKDLYVATMAELRRLSDQLGGTVVQPVGTLRIAGLPGPPADDTEEAERARELRDVTAEAATLRSWDVPVEDYDGELGRGFYNPQTAGMNPVHRAYALAGRLSPRSRLFEHTAATSIRAGVVETRRGAVHAPIIIVAVDGKLPELLPALAHLVQTVRLQMLATAPTSRRRLPCPTSFRYGYEWAQQDATGRILVGGGRDRFAAAEATTDDEPTQPVQQWLDGVAERLAAEPVSVTHRWAASVGYTQDRRAPVVLVDEGVAACGGYSGSGNLVGPLAARAAVALALDGTRPPDYFRSSL